MTSVRALLLAAALPCAALAQTYPSKPFHLIVPFDAVGSSPEAFAAFLKADRANAKLVIERTGIRLDAVK